MTGRVVVVGSINADTVLRVPEQPVPGQTVLARSQRELPGGKGGNQASAAAKVGARTLLVGCVGNDAAGSTALADLQAAGVDVGAVSVVGEPTGRAYVTVSDDGENSIVVLPGANAWLSAELVESQLAGLGLAAGDVLVVSLEVSKNAAEAAVAHATGRGAQVVVNPAPARALSDVLVRDVVLTPNEHESRAIGGAAELLRRGARAVVVTRGPDGCSVRTSGVDRAVRAVPVDLVDTTGAGDTFNGALAARLAELGSDDESLITACTFAAAAASLSTRRAGARDGQPRFHDVLAALEGLRT
jgi:ribokinase